MQRQETQDLKHSHDKTRYLPQVVQEAGGRPDDRPASLLPAGAQPLGLVGVALPGRALDQNHVEVFLGPSQPLGQDAAVALVHEQQDTSRPAAGQVGQQLIDRVSLLQVGLEVNERT